MSKQGQDGQPDEPQDLKPARGMNLVRMLQGHGNVVMGIAFDPEGRTLASGSDDSTVKIWDASDGRLLRTLSDTPDGRLLRTLESRGDDSVEGPRSGYVGRRPTASGLGGGSGSVEGRRSGFVRSVAFGAGGLMLASGGDDGTVKIWDASSGRLLRTLRGYGYAVNSVAFGADGQTLANGCVDSTVKIWDASDGRLLRTLRGHSGSVRSVAFGVGGRALASAGDDGTVKIWDASEGTLLQTLEGHSGPVGSVAFRADGRTLASGSDDSTVKIWDAARGKLLRTLEGHIHSVEAVAFSSDGHLLASKSEEGSVWLWNCETWEMAAVIPNRSSSGQRIKRLAFHPRLPLLATSGLKLGGPRDQQSNLIHFWELNPDVLLGKAPEDTPEMRVVHHTTAKIVLVGDHSVGKSGLGWRLAHGEFKEQASTHGQQFWVLPQLGKLRDDGTECEAILWDLAGQPDYRLIHALFLDDVDLALILFDSSNIGDPLHGVEFWLKQLQVGQESHPSDSGGGRLNCRTILVGAQADRGTPTLTLEELDEFCRRRGIGGYVSTSAKEGWGLEELIEQMKELIRWEEKSATTTTITFKRIKDYVLELKERQDDQPVIVTPQKLRRQLEEADAEWQFTGVEMMKTIGHLENYGYVKRLRTSKGEERVLLAPELLNNLAASFILEARRNPKGLGSLEEKRLLAGEYSFPETEKLSPAERDILLDSAALLFLEHNVCFRETDPLSQQSYLVFPELINLKKPRLEDEQVMEDGVSYTVAGAIENVYASLVVLLGYTQTFTRTNQWRSQSRYELEVSDGLICGFRQDAERAGELDFVLYFGTNVGRPVRTVFQGLFESFLARRNLSVFRFEPVACSKGHALNRVVVRDEVRAGNAFAFCSKCGERLTLPRTDVPIQLTQTEQRKVEEQQWFAARRSRFEQAVFQVMSYVDGQKLPRPDCFISYAWGEREHERWVERNLATDLQKAGIGVVLDRWENARVGASVSRFVERIEKCDRVIVVGTPLYRKKYENKDTSAGYVLAAEVDLIAGRMLGTEAEKETVLPLLLDGEEKTALPVLLQRRVYADFRDERAYFTTAFDLILSLFNIAPKHPAVADLRESLREPDLH